MKRKPDKKLAAALAAQATTEKALVLAEVAAKRSQTAKVEFKLAKRTWKLARKAARRTAKEARLRQKQLAKFARLLKKTKSKAAAKPARAKTRRLSRKPAARKTHRPAMPSPVSTAPATPVSAPLSGGI